jgi:hypothetical protein
MIDDPQTASGDCMDNPSIPFPSRLTAFTPLVAKATFAATHG